MASEFSWRSSEEFSGSAFPSFASSKQESTHQTFSPFALIYFLRRASVGVILLAFTIMGEPALKSAPAIVQFENRETMRAGGDGFIREVFVQDGQRVKKGEELLRLENLELANEVSNLKRQVNEAAIQYRIHTKEGETVIGSIRIGAEVEP